MEVLRIWYSTNTATISGESDGTSHHIKHTQGKPLLMGRASHHAWADASHQAQVNELSRTGRASHHAQAE